MYLPQSFKDLFDQNILKLIYYGVIYLNLSYGSKIWGSAVLMRILHQKYMTTL